MSTTYIGDIDAWRSTMSNVFRVFSVLLILPRFDLDLLLSDSSLVYDRVTSLLS